MRGIISMTIENRGESREKERRGSIVEVHAGGDQ
jgi:hypothetical protein